jgi:hypothetical protein
VFTLENNNNSSKNPTLSSAGVTVEMLNEEDTETQFQQRINTLYQRHQEFLKQYKQLTLRFSHCVMNLPTLIGMGMGMGMGMGTGIVTSSPPSSHTFDLSSFVLMFDFNGFYGLLQ